MKLAQFTHVGKLGLIKDISPELLPASSGEFGWSDATNMRFINMEAQKMNGYAPVLESLPIQPWYISQAISGTDTYYVYLSDKKAYTYDGITHSNITRQTTGVDVDYAASKDYMWQSCHINNFPVFNNGLDAPQVWKPINASTKLTALPNWPTNHKANFVRSYKAYLIAGDITDGSANRVPEKVIWSDAALPGDIPQSWAAAANNDAGEISLSDSIGQVIDGLELGDNFFIYKPRSTYMLTFIGGNEVFAFQMVFPSSGILTRDCVCVIDHSHFVVTADDVVQHDGHSIQSIIDNKNRRWLFSNINQDFFNLTFVAPNYARNEVWICFPGPASNKVNKALIYNYRENTWTQRDLPEIYSMSTLPVTVTVTGPIDSYTGIINTYSNIIDYSIYNRSAWSLLMPVPANSEIMLMDYSTNTDDGTPFTASIERTMIPLDPPEQIKTINRVWVYTSTDGPVSESLSVYVGGQMNKGAGIAWQGPFLIDPSQTSKIDCFVTGRYLSIRFSTNTDISWSLQGFDVEYSIRGRW